MKTKHTPTPWQVYRSSSAKITGFSIVNQPSKIEQGYSLAHVTTQEDAERIVSCVNALDGIEDPKKFRETWEAIKHLELDKYQKTKQKLIQANLELGRMKLQNRLLREQIDLLETMAFPSKSIGCLDELKGGVK